MPKLGYGDVYPAFLANDGNRTNVERAGSCAVTQQEEYPWWVVDLGVPMTVKYILLTNHGQCCWKVAINFIVGLTNVHPLVNSPEMGNYNVCGQYSGLVPQGATVKLQCEKTDLQPARYVIVQLPIAEQFPAKRRMRLCELEVYTVEGCLAGPQTLEQYACEGKDMYVSCGESMIHVVDANYGRLDNSMCADQLGTPNDNCRQDATCLVRKWCEGRSRCVVSVNSDQFVDRCPATSKYLQVNYQCVTGHDCDANNPCSTANEGSNFPHVNPAIYITCGSGSQCTETPCPVNTIWNQEMSACVIDPI